MQGLWKIAGVVAGGLWLAGCGAPQLPNELGASTEAVGDPAVGADGKVLVCHIPPGNPANAHTISVGAPAVKAHLAHGDVLGACGGTPPPPPPPETDAGTPPPPPPPPPACGDVGASCGAAGDCCSGLVCLNAGGLQCGSGDSSCSCEQVLQ